jgi:hypothetical protein
MICDQAFVPRYDRVVLDGTGTDQLLLRTSDPGRSVASVRTIRSVKMASTPDGTFVAFTAGQLAALTARRRHAHPHLRRHLHRGPRQRDRRVRVRPRPAAGRPGPGVADRLRSQLNVNKSGSRTGRRASPSTDGGTFRLDMPGAFKTGVPTVDAAYGRYSRRSTGTGRPAGPCRRRGR